MRLENPKPERRPSSTNGAIIWNTLVSLERGIQTQNWPTWRVKPQKERRETMTAQIVAEIMTTDVDAQIEDIAKIDNVKDAVHARMPEVRQHTVEKIRDRLDAYIAECVESVLERMNII